MGIYLRLWIAWWELVGTGPGTSPRSGHSIRRHSEMLSANIKSNMEAQIPPEWIKILGIEHN